MPPSGLVAIGDNCFLLGLRGFNLGDKSLACVYVGSENFTDFSRTGIKESLGAAGTGKTVTCVP